MEGRGPFGRPRQPWAGEAVAPAGGIRASIRDMSRLTAAILDGSAPGIGGLEPVPQTAGRPIRIGAAWLTVRHRGQTITWHNGGTGGFRSFMGFDRAAHAGVVVLSAATASVDRAGFTLLQQFAGN
ncbi:serine hydrolase [Nocardia sp. NPDC004654]|uniref:serine hydrolase n=1 Tax=Nocardia sp. NPDC004654 TaxID=3154776 RepID=UPI0033B1D988